MCVSINEYSLSSFFLHKCHHPTNLPTEDDGWIFAVGVAWLLQYKVIFPLFFFFLFSSYSKSYLESFVLVGLHTLCMIPISSFPSYLLESRILQQNPRSQLRMEQTRNHCDCWRSPSTTHPSPHSSNSPLYAS